MVKKIELYGDWAFVAGSAEGLGEAFSTVLAQRGMNLVMADINGPALDRVAPALEEKYGIRAVRLPIDLSAPDAWEHCIAAVAEYDCRLMVYNAAYSHVRPFTEHSHEVLDRFVNVNARSVIHLVSAFIARLTSAGMPGGILLMSSLSGVIAPPLVAPYAATKAFNVKLAESLFYELKPLNIRISACTAGITSTPKFWESQPRFGRFKPAIMEAVTIAEFAIRNLGRKPALTPGWQNRLSYFLLTRIFPKGLSLKLVSRTMQRMYAGRQTN